MILEQGVTVLCCTPTYAARLREVAEQEKIDLSSSQVKLLLVAGEPGGSIPATRERIEKDWPGARVFDHHGMTEVGPVSFQCPEQPGVLHIMENSYIAEVIDPVTGKALEAGQRGELVLTTLGRLGSPLLRYRTGDLVKTALDTVCTCGRSELALEGGILGRADDMVIVRGVNVYPTAVEAIIHACDEVAEYRVELNTSGALSEMNVQIEPAPGCTDPAGIVRQLEEAFQVALALRVPVRIVEPGTLPRFELKARRWERV
jgi:phenylacetate-CoA ligase